MKVLLLQNVQGLGKKGEVREASNGHTRNFLLPKRLAVIATPDMIRRIDADQTARAARRVALVQELTKKAEALKSVTLTFVRKTGERGETFGSVTAEDIEAELSHHDFKDCKAELKHPLKHVGAHDVTIDLGEGIRSTVIVAVEEEKP